MLGRNLHVEILVEILKRCWPQSAIGFTGDVLRLLPQAGVWQSFGMELDGQVPKTLVELMGIFLLSAMFSRLLHFPRFKAVFSFS